jgi:hypothetical protein
VALGRRVEGGFTFGGVCHVQNLDATVTVVCLCPATPLSIIPKSGLRSSGWNDAVSKTMSKDARVDPRILP